MDKYVVFKFLKQNGASVQTEESLKMGKIK